MNDELLTTASRGHSEADRKRRSKNASKIRKDARAATERCNRRMVNAQLKCNPPSKYRIGEKVYIQLPKKGGSKGGQKECHIIEALIQKTKPSKTLLQGIIRLSTKWQNGKEMVNGR